MADEAQLGADHYEDAFALLAELTQHFAEALELDRTLERALESIDGFAARTAALVE